MSMLPMPVFALLTLRGELPPFGLPRLIHEPAALGRAGFDVSVAA